MGIRLYPRTKIVANLETLAGVPAGTAARLETFEAEWNARKREGKVDGYEEYCARKADDSLDTYHSFLLFGWGKVSGGLLSSRGFESGNENDQAKCQEILKEHFWSWAQKPPLPIDEMAKLSEGLCWN